MKAVPRRKPNAQATREEILRQAVICFASDSYDRVGVRQIAAAAGVDAALVIRYFGSKEDLYIEAVRRTQQPIGDSEDLRADLPLLGRRFAEAVVAPEIKDRLLLTLRAATSPGGAPLVSTLLQEIYSAPLAGALEGEHARLRADLLNAVLLGAAVTYWSLEFESMRGENEADFVALTARLVQSLVDNPEPAD